MHAMEENQMHARLAEEKRAATAHIGILTTAAIQIALTFVGLSVRSISLTLLLILIGLYGLSVTAKLYERSQFHILRARTLRAHLDEMCPDAQVQSLQNRAEKEHRKHYPRLTDFRLNTIWLALHALIVLIGIIETCIAYLSR